MVGTVTEARGKEDSWTLLLLLSFAVWDYFDDLVDSRVYKLKLRLNNPVE